MNRQNKKNAVVLERVGEWRIMLELIKKRKRNWLGQWLRRNWLLKDALQGMANGKNISNDRQHYDKWTVWRYEKEGWGEGRVENAEFAVKDLSLGRTLWLIDWLICYKTPCLCGLKRSWQHWWMKNYPAMVHHSVFLWHVGLIEARIYHFVDIFILNITQIIKK